MTIVLYLYGHCLFRQPGRGAEGEGGDGEVEAEVKVREVGGGPVEAGFQEVGAKGEGPNYGIGHDDIKKKGTLRTLAGEAEGPGVR